LQECCHSNRSQGQNQHFTHRIESPYINQYDINHVATLGEGKREVQLSVTGSIHGALNSCEQNQRSSSQAKKSGDDCVQKSRGPWVLVNSRPEVMEHDQQSEQSQGVHEQLGQSQVWCTHGNIEKGHSECSKAQKYHERDPIAHEGEGQRRA
jgi:hypothetical protein